jgi:predicted phage tail protein
MNDLSSPRVLLSTGLVLAASFVSPALLAAEEAPAPELGSGAGLDHPAGVLERFARDEHDTRVTNAWWTMGGGALLVASGLITVAGDHESWGHLVWISGGVSLLGGFAQLFIPGELERLESESGGRTPGYSPAALDAAWKAKADGERTMRHVAGITNLSLGAAGITAGSLLAAGVGDMSHSDRVGWSVGCFVAGGVLTLGGVITLLVPSNTEKGYHIAFPPPSVRMDVGVAPAPGGGTLQLTGSF